jgi:hypothetical protein
VITYKSGDFWKVIALVVLIAATFFISFRFILAAGAGPPASPRPQQQTARQAAAPTAPLREMFAQRARPPSELLVRARSTGDPFKPYVTSASTASPQPGAAPAPAAGPRPRPAGTLPSARTSPQVDYRLVGMITGDHLLAVIAGSETRYFVRLGDSLPGGWHLVRLNPRAVTLAKGEESVTLTLSQESPAT